MNVYTPTNVIVHEVDVHFESRIISKPIHVVQYDDRLPVVKVNLYTGNNGDEEYELPEGADVNIRYCRPDGHVVYNPVLGKDSTSNNVVYFEITQAMLIKNGKGRGVLEVTLNGKLACSSEIIFEIDRNPIQEDSIEATDEFKSVVQYAAEAESAASSVRELTVGATTGEPGTEAIVVKSGGTGPNDPYHLQFTIPKGETGSAGNISVVAEEYSATKTYSEGQYVIYNNDLYVAKVDISTAEAWNANHWTKLNIGDALYDQKVKMDHKADIDGSYEDLTAGSAEQLLSDKFVEDNVAYNFRKTAGGKAVGNRAIDEIIGGTLVINQLIDHENAILRSEASYDSNTHRFTIDVAENAAANNYVRFPELPLVVGHKYFLRFKVVAISEGASFRCYFPFSSSSTTVTSVVNDRVFEYQSDYYNYLYVGKTSAVTQAQSITFEVTLVDITQMFDSSTIANYVYSLETTTAGSGVTWLYEYFPILNGGYIPHNIGTLQSIVLSKRKLTEFNQWNEEWENGTYNNQGIKQPNSALIRTKNPIKVTPSSNYYISVLPGGVWIGFYDVNNNFISKIDISGGVFTTPNNAYYLTFHTYGAYGAIYKNDICINFSGIRNGEYEPYNGHEYTLDSSKELRGVPKIDSNGKLYFYGDRYKDNVTRIFAHVNLNLLNWEYNETYGVFKSTDITNAKQHSSLVLENIICSVGYIPCGRMTSETPNLSITLNSSSHSINSLFIKDTKYGKDVAAFKASLADQYLDYELATPTAEDATSVPNPQICSPDGTEEYIDPRVEAGTIPFAIPTGHNTQYLQNLRQKLDDLPFAPSENGDYILRKSNDGTEYVLYTGIRVITISDPTTTMGDISEILTEVNTVGDHVLFDVASLGASMYMCTIFIDTNASKYKIVDLVNGKVAEGAYASSLLLTMALAQATDMATHEQIEVLQREIDELGGKTAISDWAVLGDKIQDGTSTDFIKLGDRVDINWIDTVLGMTSKGLTVTCSDKNKFINAVGEAEEKQYLFVYDGNSWTYEGEAITLSDYGLNVAGTPTTGEVMTISTTVIKRNYTFTSYDTIEPSDESVTHNWLLEETYAPDAKALDTYEALFAVYQGKTVPVGNYHLRNYSYRSGFYVDIYLGVTSPIGSNDYIVQARSNGYLVQSITNADAVTKADVYSISGLTPTIYGTRNNASGAVSITYAPVEGVTYTELTALNVDENSPVVYAYEGVFDKCALGSNNWDRSNLNTWLNDDTAAKASCTPSYELDIVSPFNLQAGFLYGIDPRAKALIQNADVKCMAGYGDEGYTQGQIYTVSEKVFLLSMREMSFSINNGEGVMTGLYGEYTNNTVNDGAVIARAKYNKAGGTLNNYRWSRSAYAWGSYRTRNVSSTGGSGYNNAITGYYYASAFIIGKSGNQ